MKLYPEEWTCVARYQKTHSAPRLTDDQVREVRDTGKRYVRWTQSLLMALDTENAARHPGTGFWGLLVGGGPWGQPCHLSHHLMPALPWYQQCRLHWRLRAMMSPEQRRHFCITPVIGFPRLLWHVLHVNFQYACELMTGQTEHAAGGSRSLHGSASHGPSTT